TQFYNESLDVGHGDDFREYDSFVQKAMHNMRTADDGAPDGEIVAQTIYNAVADGSKRVRYGVNTKGILVLRKFLPDSLFFPLIKMAILK
ncbi:MAG: short-chain dehydrogenase/reductase, partial [Pyrinomonadaceae bacterium]